MINIYPFKQTDDSRCGPAVIKMILSYYGIDALEEDICQRCEHTYELGCTDLQMKKAIESYGLGCAIIDNSDLADVEYWIRHKVPLIVDWFSPGDITSLGDMPNGHASIIVDIDVNNVYLLDPEIGAIRAILRDEFLRCWFDWREDPFIQRCDDLVLRQIMVVYPKRIKDL